MDAAAAIAAFLPALEKTQYLPPERMRAYQRRLLDPLLRHARRETDFYADRLAPLFRADGSIDWERWGEIPILTRSQAQAHEAALTARTLPKAAGRALPATTSGSTGRPLRHFNTDIQNLVSTCANERFFAWHGLDPAALAGLIVHLDHDDALYPAGRMTRGWREIYKDSPAAILNIDTPVHRQVEWLRRVRPATLTTFPSNMREIGRIAAEQGAHLAFAALLTMGEAVSPETRTEIRELFGRDPIDRYGSTEVGHIAGSCPASGRYHICSDLVLIEIVDAGGRPVEPGVPGRIVATSFYNLATPFIRYDTGDIGIPAAGPCACDRTLPLLERILGRERNIFRFGDGTSALPHLESKEVQAFVPHRQFQVVQTAVGRIEYRYVPVDPQQRNDVAGLTAYVHRYLHPSLAVEAIAVEDIPRSQSGKYEDYVSLVPEVASA